MGFIAKLMRETSEAGSRIPSSLLDPAPTTQEGETVAQTPARIKAAASAPLSAMDQAPAALQWSPRSLNIFDFNSGMGYGENVRRYLEGLGYTRARDQAADDAMAAQNAYNAQAQTLTQFGYAPPPGQAPAGFDDGNFFDEWAAKSLGGYKALESRDGSMIYSLLLDPSGNIVASDSYDANDGGWFEAAVPSLILGMATAGIGQALGAGAGAGATGSLTGPGALDAYAAMDAAYGTAGVGGASGAAGAAGGAVGVGAAESVAPAVFNAAADSQAYNAAAGITGGQAASAATAPATVNLINAGGTMATAGGINGAANTAAQAIRDATASSNVGGSLLSQAGSVAGDALSTAGSAAGDVAAWMKANPVLGRLLMSGATSLLSASGGAGSAGGAAGGSAEPVGPPVQWQSDIQRGLLSPVKRATPPQLSGLGLLDVAGEQNDGAWRYLRG